MKPGNAKVLLSGPFEILKIFLRKTKISGKIPGVHSTDFYLRLDFFKCQGLKSRLTGPG